MYGTRSRDFWNLRCNVRVFLAQKIANKPFTIVGDGSQTRDFTYVSDIIRALITVAKKKCKKGIQCWEW